MSAFKEHLKFTLYAVLFLIALGLVGRFDYEDAVQGQRMKEGVEAELGCPITSPEQQLSLSQKTRDNFFNCRKT